MGHKTAIIIGAGPAGLTAAYELQKQTEIVPIVLEMSGDIGGLAKTVNYKGNRIDIGGHRFFSKSDRVMQWWNEILPLQGASQNGSDSLPITYQQRSREIDLPVDGPNPDSTDEVMLVRERLSRIFFLRKFFDYPLSLSWGTIRSLGFWRLTRIGVTYIWAKLFPIKNERTLEDFFLNRFGRELYQTFFKDYTEKVWGVPCTQLEAEWGAQRIKGLSLTKALMHAAKRLVTRGSDVEQKDVETSLIERFLYPKYGPGQMWEETARRVTAAGGEVHLWNEVIGIECQGQEVVAVRTRDTRTGEERRFSGDYVFSTMAIKDLVAAMNLSGMPTHVREIAGGLQYRDFITVGLLLEGLRIDCSQSNDSSNAFPDNWVYVQERDVKLGRIQVFNNWSPYMVDDPDKIWLGLEYFCYEGDELWSMEDAELTQFAGQELSKLGFIDPSDVLDSVVIRMPKAYPAYTGTYSELDRLREFVDDFPNLFLIGRNGMHRYNNQDHSMLTAMEAVHNIANGILTKDNIWSVNVEQEYHEEKSAD